MNPKFDDFQLDEYRNISSAHFEANKQIGIFFRYFLIIASAPAIIFVWFGGNDNFLNDLLQGDNTNINLFIGFFLIFIAIIGMLSCFYIISIRLDSILYARAVNGIRKYFYKNKVDFEEQYRILPKNINQPKYRDIHTFGIIVFALAIIDAIYFSIGTRIIATVGNDFFTNYLGWGILFYNYKIWETIFIFFIILSVHLLYYNFISIYRKNIYMKSSIIGIDIDGVLNKHRDTFCNIHMTNMLNKYGDNLIPEDKKLTPNEISRIPVNLIETKNISIHDEFDVFNNPAYWNEQVAVKEGIGKVIKELKNSYGYKIHIHSYRPWPQYEYGEILDESKINELWRIKSLNLWNNKKIRFGKSQKLKRLTAIWLKNLNIPYNKLFIEKSSIDFSRRSISLFGLVYNISRGQFRNRFYYTHKKPYRYFVEDSADNAIKLASTCEYVFLLEQPYNIEAGFIKDLPSNVLRVENWSDIKNIIKELG